MGRTKTNFPTVRERRLRRLLEGEQLRREQAEAAASAWQDRFRLFLDHAPMPAFIRDEQGRHVYGNKPWAAQFDRPLSELIGKTNWELFPKETAFDVTDLVLAKTRLSDFEADLATGRLVPELPRVQSDQLTKLSPRLRQVLELLAAG